MKQKRLYAVSIALLCCTLRTLCAEESVYTGKSRIDWTVQRFYSDITFNTERAGFRLPTDKTAAARQLLVKLPVLVKDPFLSLYMDADSNIDDVVRSGTVTLEQITALIEGGRRTAPVFDRDGVTLKTTNTISLTEIPRLIARQRHPASPREPIDVIPSRAYSGIIIDARGALPIHGEYISSTVSPCFFPRVWNTDMDVIYERATVELAVTQKNGIVSYHWSDDRRLYEDRIGIDPLFITAEKVYGRNRTDPVIRTEDALRILTVPENRQLLREGKVVILLDRDNLVYDVSVPLRGPSYYALYDRVREYVYRDMTDVDIINTVGGITFSIGNLRFYPDSSELLPAERARIVQIAEQLRTIIADGEYTVLIEGHTADIGRPVGQQNLSVERTRTVMRELIAQGIDETLFSYVGYGGTRPIAPNDTEAGRAQNRRVDITARPRATYIQRQ